MNVGASDLLSMTELRDYLKLGTTSPDDDGILQVLIDSMHASLENATGEQFGASGVYTDEQYIGNGSTKLWVDRPVSVLTTVKIGALLATPDESLDTSRTDVVRIDRRYPRRVVRTDSGVFTRDVTAFVSYTSLDNRPLAAKLALRDGCAFAWRRLGSEEVKTESVGPYSRSLIEKLDDVPLWKQFVDQYRALAL